MPFMPVDGMFWEITGLGEMKWAKDAKLRVVKVTHMKSKMGGVHIVGLAQEAPRHPGRDPSWVSLKGH